MWHIFFWYPGGNSEVSPSHVSNNEGTLFICLHMLSNQIVLPLSSSNEFDSPTDSVSSLQIFECAHILRLDLTNDSTAFYQRMLNILWKFWLTRNASLHCIFNKLERLGVLHTLLRNTGRAPILPLYKSFPTLCHLPSALVTISCCDESILLLDL